MWNQDEYTDKFTINTIGEKTKSTYMGQFVVKTILSPMDQINADKLYRSLLGENFLMASEKAKQYAFALSQLKYRIVSCPPFWEHRELGGSHIGDVNILAEIIHKAIEKEENFNKTIERRTNNIEKVLTEKVRSGEISKEDETVAEDNGEEEIEEASEEKSVDHLLDGLNDLEEL